MAIPTYLGYPSEGANGPAAMCLGSYGISAKTEHSDICWNFLKQLLNEDNQINYFSAMGIPMLKSIFYNDLERAALDPLDENSFFYGWSDDSVHLRMTEEEVEYLRALAENIDHIRFRYNAVQTIITEEAAAYFDGDKSAEEVAAIIQNRVQTYIAEQG